MHTALLNRHLEALRAVRKHILFSSNLRNQITSRSFTCKADREGCFNAAAFHDAADPINWKVIDHSAAIIRVYALFESFVQQILREYLIFLSEKYTLSDLGTDFRTRYTRGIGQILIDHDKQRYKNIDVVALFSAASAAISDKQGSQFQPEALLRPEQNLRMQELQRLFTQCGLPNLESWVTAHRDMENFFNHESRLSETPESELRQIVQYRNEAAHGDVDEVLGPDVLVEFTEFFEALCRSIVEFVQYDTLQRAKKLGTASVIGVIFQRYREDIIVAKVRNATLRVGENIYVLGSGITMAAVVQSIQLDNIPVNTVTVTTEREVGLRIGVRANTGYELIRIT